MPYISQQRRQLFDEQIDNLIKTIVSQPDDDWSADLTYTIYRLVLNLYGHGKWNRRSEALKVLESVKLEFYRRNLALYEDGAIARNGDIAVSDSESIVCAHGIDLREQCPSCDIWASQP